MFPTPIERTATTTRGLHRIALSIALWVWLLPPLAVVLTAGGDAGR